MVGTKESISRTETEEKFPTCQTHILQGLYQLLLTAYAYTLQEKFRVIPKFQIHESVNERIGYVIDNIHMIQEDNSWSLCIGKLFPEIWRYAFDDFIV
jgi:hypothetical protein